VLARLEAVVEGEGEQRGDALAVRRQLADIDATVRPPEGLHPLRTMGEEIGLGEPARGRNRRSDLPLVERLRATHLDPAKRCSEVGKRVPLSESGSRPRGDACLRPLVGDARAAREAGFRKIGCGAECVVEPEPTEPGRKIVPQAHGAGNRDGAGSLVVSRRSVAELSG